MFFFVNRFKTRMATLIIVMLSVLVSTRYLWWRTTETLGFVDPFDMMFGYGLYAAEVYAWIVLMIGYFQVIWPLDASRFRCRRRPGNGRRSMSSFRLTMKTSTS